MGLFGPSKKELESKERIAREARESEERQARLAAEYADAADRREKAAALRRERQKLRIESNERLGMAEIENNRLVELEKTKTELKIAQEEASAKRAQAQAEAVKAKADSDARKTVAQEQSASVQAQANRDIELAEKEKQVRVREIEFKEAAMKEVAGMFTKQLQYMSEAYQKELEYLRDVTVERRVKFMAALESARKEKNQLLLLSKDAKGQEKLDYLNKMDELEQTIRDLQANDAEADKDAQAQIARISFAQKREIENNPSKLIATNNLFLSDIREADRNA